MGSRHVVLAVAVAVVLSSSGPVRASDPTLAVWLGGAGSWSDGAMWNIGVPPSAPPGYLVLIDAGNPANSVVLLDIPAEVYGLGLGVGDSLTTAAAMTLTVRALSGACTIDNAGVITLASAPAGSLVIADGDVGLTGGGAVNLRAARMTGVGSAPALFNWDNTISGSGNFDSLTLTNLSLIQANEASKTLTLRSGVTTTNLGTLAATGGGVLRLEGYLYNTGGTVRADDGSRVELAGGTCVGGLLQSIGTGVLSVAGNQTLEDVSLSGRLEVSNGQTATLKGTIANAGQIALPSAGGAAVLRVGGAGSPVTLSGPGTVLLSDGSGSRIVAATSGDRLINDGNTISGAGRIGDNMLYLTNRGAIDANLSGKELRVDLSGSGTTSTTPGGINPGTFRASGGGILVLADTSLNNLQGVIRAGSGSKVRLENSAVSGGALSADDAATVELYGAALIGVTLSTSGTGTVSVFSGSPVYFDGVTNTGQVSLSSGAQLYVFNSLTNTGQVTMSLVNPSTLILQGTATGQEIVLFGGGTISLPGTAMSTISGVSGHVLANVDNTIAGAGYVGSNMLRLRNEGIIEANLPAKELRLDLSGSSGTYLNSNSGTLRATSGGILTIYDTWLSNVGGTILAGAGSKVRLENSGLSGGNVRADDGGTVELSGATLTGVTLGTSGTGTVWVSIGSPIYFDGVTNTGQVSLSSGAQLYVFNSLTNTGQVTMSLVNPSTLILQGTVSGQEIVLSGGGTITMPGVSGAGNTIRASSSDYRLVNLDNTISGAGYIGSNSLRLHNAGVIEASLDRRNLIVDLTDSTAPAGVNRGIMRATGGGYLRIQGSVFDNTGGTIQAVGTNSAVYLTSSSIRGGTVSALDGAGVNLEGATLSDLAMTTAGTGKFNLWSGSPASTLANVSLSGKVQVNDSATLRVSGTILNGGEVFLNSTGSGTTLEADLSAGDVILSGGGTVRMSGYSANTIRATGGTPYRLVNDGNTICGAGSIGQNTLRLTNQGVIDAHLPSSTLTVDLYDDAGPSYGNINTGTLRASNGGILALKSTGLLNVGGTIQAQADSQVRLESVTLSGGTVQALDRGTVVLSGSGNSLGGLAFGTTGSGLVRIETDAKLTDCANTGSLEILSGGKPTIYGSLVNSRTLSLASTGATTTLWAGNTSSDVYLTGGGNILMGSAGPNEIRGYNSPYALVNADNTISGAGHLGAGTMRLVNHGTIRADVNPAPLEVRPLNSPTASINTGTMQALGGGRLRVFGFWDNSGGVIEALDSSTVELWDFDISGGTLRTAGSGTIAASSSGLLKDLEVAGRFQTSMPLTLTLGGAITNTGRIEVGSPFGPVTARVRDSITTLSGGGTVALSHGAMLSSEMSNSRLVNVDNTIEGSGIITAAMINRGTVRANVAGEFLYVDSPGYAAVNHGLFRAVGGGTLLVRTRVPGTGRWSADGGTVEVDGAGWAYGGLAEAVNGGLLSVMGWITVEDLQVDAASRIQVSGTVQARRLAFALTDEGAWDWSDASTLSMVGGPNLPVSLQPTCEIGGEDFGPVLGGFTGNFHLGGLFVSGGPMGLVDLTDNGNRADHGYGSAEALYVKDLAIGTGGSIALDSLHLYYLNGGDPKQFFPADVDLDGDVDFADYQTLEVNFGQAGVWGQGDFDGDGMVDFSDYQTLESCFGQVTPLGAPGSVPEPGGAFLLLCGAVAVLRRGRKSSGRRHGDRGVEGRHSAWRMEA